MGAKDSVWKEAIETYFHDFLRFFFPHIAGDIDFDRGYDFLTRNSKGFFVNPVPARDMPMSW